MEKNNIKIFLIENKDSSFKFYNTIDEKEFLRVCEILKINNISYLINSHNEFYVEACPIRYFDLVEELY